MESLTDLKSLVIRPIRGEKRKRFFYVYNITCSVKL
jgi:hypothetical protein